ncbi:kinase-like domain-containing protein [Glomus cerebriforme]|uniref:Kinase-like domain-containing protein n=1 Tax=Glomus cerebriforme TaxID=658196 RepID=A0A397T6P0_9GLOM|nr:kinase-like domain-containing protein [Glomus cerebriforme]
MEQNFITKEVYEQIKDFKSFHLSKEQKVIVDQLIPNEELKERYKKFTLCKECYQPCTKRRWCSPCIAKHFQDDFKNWTSENIFVDKTIRDLQLKAEDNVKILEWIEYDRFYDVEYLAKGGFGTVYKAKWKDGYIINWDVENKQWKRFKDIAHRLGPDRMVVLKFLNDSQDISPEFVKELGAHIEMNGSIYVIQCYGMSKDPKTKNFILVMDYQERGSIRYYLDKHFDSIYWEEKLYILQNIAEGLSRIHKRDLVHRDFHSGNILKGINFEATITDLGLSRPAKELNRNGKNEIFGVLPYIAPEVLQGKDYTEKSDIYSFGVLCYEVITGLRPHHDMAHDGHLALKIIKGFRPKFKIKVPKLLLDLINQCWDSDPSKRPNAENISKMISPWREDLNIPNYESEFYKQYDEADEYNKTHKTTESTELQQSIDAQPAYQSHPQAIYTSRILEPLSGELDLEIPDIDMDDCSNDDDNDEE